MLTGCECALCGRQADVPEERVHETDRDQRLLPQGWQVRTRAYPRGREVHFAVCPDCSASDDRTLTATRLALAGAAAFVLLWVLLL